MMERPCDRLQLTTCPAYQMNAGYWCLFYVSNHLIQCLLAFYLPTAYATVPKKCFKNWSPVLRASRVNGSARKWPFGYMYNCICVLCIWISSFWSDSDDILLFTISQFSIVFFSRVHFWVTIFLMGKRVSCLFSRLLYGSAQKYFLQSIACYSCHSIPESIHEHRKYIQSVVGHKTIFHSEMSTSIC